MTWDRLLGWTAITATTGALMAVLLTPSAAEAFGEVCWRDGVPTSHGACAQNHCEPWEDGQRCNDGSWITGSGECDCPEIPEA